MEIRSGAEGLRGRPPVRLGVVAAGAPDPWDVVIYPELEARGIDPVILGAPGEEIPVPTVVVETYRRLNPWRKIRPLTTLGRMVHGFATEAQVRFLPSPFAFDGAIVGLRRLLREYDVALAFETYHASTYQACKAHDAVVVKVTENIAHNPPHIPFSSFKRYVRARARRIVCVSESAREALRAEGSDERKITVIPEPVDTREFRPFPTDARADGAFVVGFAGRLAASHGIFDLLEAFAHLSVDREIRLRIAGAGTSSADLEAAVARHGPKDRVEYAGRLRHRDMPSFLNGIDVLCVPCREIAGWKPQFGIVNAEAMACGKPIVATRCGATPEIVPPGLQGFLVSPGDVRALRDRLETLARDPDLAVRLGAEARDWAVQRFDSRRVADRWAELIQEIAEGREGAAESRRTFA